MRTLLLSFLGLTLTQGSALANPQQSFAEIDAFLTETLTTLDIKHGIAIRIIKDGEVAYRRDAGHADIQRRTAVDEHTAFYIASVTKPFTALAALRLAEQGKIDLDRSLQSFFPELTFDPAIRPDEVRLRHLLTHTSGIDNDGLVLATAFSGIHTPESLLGILAQSRAREEAPLGTFEYSNVGYNIFSLILTRELGAPWQEVLDEQVFQPLGMARTSSYISVATDRGWVVARPYSFASPDPEQPLYLEKTDSTMHAAGGMIASADDLGRMVIAQLNGGKVDGRAVFAPRAIAYSQKLIAEGESEYSIFKRLGYGFGWRIGSLDGEPLLHHFGGYAGTHAHVSFMPRHGIGLVVLSNEDMLSSRLTPLIAAYVYGALTGKDGFEAPLRAQLAGMASQLPTLRARFAAELEKRAAREWQLSLDRDAYAGTYSHPLYGDIRMTMDHNQVLHASFGNLQAEVTAFTQPETVRVEFVPGSGRVISFGLEDGRPGNLRYEGIVFDRSH